MMRLLAAEPQYLTIAKLYQLYQTIAPGVSQSQVIQGMESLVRRSLVEVQKDRETVYNLQPAIGKYVTTKWSGD